MNWYKKSSSHVKYLYHVSPESHLQFLRPRGRKSGVQAIQQEDEGVFAAPTFNDAVRWFVSYVMHKKPNKYKQGTIYTLAVPKNIIKDLWKENWWEKEYFIPRKYLNQIKIVGRETLSKEEMQNKYNRDDNVNFKNKIKEIDQIISQNKRDVLIKRFVNLRDRWLKILLKKNKNDFIFNKERINDLFSDAKSILSRIYNTYFYMSSDEEENKTEKEKEKEKLQECLNKIEKELNTL